MGRIKELQEKLTDGSITEEEKVELETLKKEALGESEEKAEEEAIEKMGEAISDVAFKKFISKMEEQKKTEEKEQKSEKKEKGEKKSPVIFDKSLGEVTIDKLAEIKVPIVERKAIGKQVTEISAKTVHFLQALLRNDVQKLQVLSEGTASAGGYLVPEEFANLIVEDLRDATVMRQVAGSLTISGDTLHLPRLDTRPQANWRAEGAVKLTTTAQFSELTFTPYSIAAIATMTQELVDDASLGVSGSIVNYIAGLIVQAIAEKEDKAFWTGSGTGQPTGVSTYSVGSRAKGANFADTIINIYHDLKQGYRGRAVWAGNSRVLAEVRQLKDSQNRYLVQDLGQTPFGSLLGRPMYEQNDLGNELYFGDFSYYKIVDRQGISVRISDEATVGGSSAFEKNLVHVRVEKRVDGELTLVEAVKKVTGV